MEYRFVKLNDITVKIGENIIGAVTDVKYSVDYKYDDESGLDTTNPMYEIIITHQLIVDIERPYFYFISGADVEILDPSGNTKFLNCITKNVTCVIDKNGVYETIHMLGGDIRYS